MPSYGSLAVMTGICKPALGRGQADQIEADQIEADQIQAGLQVASEAQHDTTKARFTDAETAVGARGGQNKEQVRPAPVPTSHGPPRGRAPARH